MKKNIYKNFQKTQKKKINNNMIIYKKKIKVYKKSLKNQKILIKI